MSSRPTPQRQLRYLPLLISALLGLGLAWLRLGPDILDPRNISWFRGDSVWHFLVWNFFRFEAWHLQPGRVANMMTPLGTSIGSGDAVPLLAFPLKLLSPLLPGHFQYLGPWLFANYVLQAVFGYLLATTLTKNRWLALLLGLFFLVSPIMIFRAGHIALSAHWLILMALWHYFAVSKAPTFRFRAYASVWLLCVGIAGLVHPYLAAMVFPLAVASLFRETFHSKRLKPLWALLLLAVMAGLLVLEWWLSGLIGGGQNLKSWGFNYFTMNLLAPFNSQGRSRILSALPIRDGQYEGFAFLGTGILALGIFALLYSLRNFGRYFVRALRSLYRRGHLLLLLFALLFFGYAIGDGLTFGNTLVPNYSVFKNFPTLISTFRAPGRFFWPTYYLLYVALFVFLLKVLPPRRAGLVLLLGLSVQLADLKFNKPFGYGQTPFRTHLKSERWPELMQGFERIVVIPAFDRNVAWRGDFIDFSFLASRYGTELTTGAVARAHLNQATTRLALQRQALKGPRGTKALYVFSSVTFAQKFYEELEPGLDCYPLNAYLVCHNSEQDLQLGAPVDTATFVPKGYQRFSLAAFVEHHKDQTVVLAVKGGPGRYSLAIKRYLVALGSKIGTIGIKQGSYVAVLNRGKLIFEDVSDDEGLTNSWLEGDLIGEGDDALRAPKGLYTYSWGTPTHNTATIATDDARHKAEPPGFTAVVLDDRFNIVRAADFNTFVSDIAVLRR